DLPFVVSAEPHAENDVVHLLGADRCVARRLAGERRLHPVEERVDLVDLVPTAQRPTPEPLTLTRHRVSLPSGSLRSAALGAAFAPRRAPTSSARRGAPGGAAAELRSLAASWPQAPSISRPRVSRTVAATPAARSRRMNSRSTGFGLASHLLPGVGL